MQRISYPFIGESSGFPQFGRDVEACVCVIWHDVAMFPVAVFIAWGCELWEAQNYK